MIGGPISSRKAASPGAVDRLHVSGASARFTVDRRRLSVSPRTAARLSVGPKGSRPSSALRRSMAEMRRAQPRPMEP
mgnify:CR=1 FL=1